MSYSILVIVITNNDKSSVESPNIPIFN